MGGNVDHVQFETAWAACPLEHGNGQRVVTYNLPRHHEACTLFDTDHHVITSHLLRQVLNTTQVSPHLDGKKDGAFIQFTISFTVRVFANDFYL